MNGLTKLKTGDFNNMSQEEQVDGTIIITLTKRGDNKIYQFRVRNLYGQNEEVLEETITEVE